MALALQKQSWEGVGIDMKIYLATWLLEPHQGRVLTKKKQTQRLISYYHTREKKKQFPGYIKTGRNPK